MTLAAQENQLGEMGKKELEKINMENAEIKKALLGKETMKFQVQIHDARNKEGDRKH
jgi:hypothetical protein